MNIQGFQKTTLLDYPKHVAATIFFGGCNFRCPFCHNGDLVLSPNQEPAFSEEEILAYLTKRRSILDGVCITGGEPTLQTRLAPFLERIKALGLAVKLDTNGYCPDMLRELCQEGLVDYIAMDIKGAPKDYGRICGVADVDISPIAESVEMIRKGRIDYEFRTTVVRELHNIGSFRAIGEWLAGVKVYYLQGYQESPGVIEPGFHAYNRKEMETFRLLLLEKIPLVEIRGVES